MAIRRNSSWNRAIVFTNAKTGDGLNFAGASLAMGFRDDINTPEIVRLSTENGGLVADSNGRVSISLTNVQTALMTEESYQWDLIWLNQGNKLLAKGSVNLEQGITSA